MNQVQPHPDGEKLENTEVKAEAATTYGKQKEVDYYLNPTELFRWINYRRWDGAKARVLSHPEECSTWIVSRHNTDGRILWRHLPLHLVCMQSENGGSDTQPHMPSHAQNMGQIEELVDILLEAYQDAASSHDDQGMLPLHLAVTSSNINPRIIFQLLMAYPGGVGCQDKFGRTPLDLIAEKKNEPNYDVVLRAMSRVHRTTETLTSNLTKENSSLIESLKQSASNERSASQHIMQRLREELVETRKKMEEMESTTSDEKKSLDNLRAQIETLQSEKEEREKFVNDIRREREDIIKQNEILRSQVQEHENIVQTLNQTFKDDQKGNSDTIAKLKSECSTAKAMAEALESQLRSRFTNEEYLTASVSELETELSDLRAEHKQEKARLLSEKDSCRNENVQLQRSIDDLSRKAASLESKLADVNKQMSAVLGSHGALNAEHDRMVENSLRVEIDLIECMRMERTNLIESMRKQMEFFENTMKNQEQMLENGEQQEMQLLDSAKTERDKNLETIKALRQDFVNARASDLERQRALQSDKLATLSMNNEQKKSLTKELKSTPSNDSRLDRSTISHRRKAKRTDSSDTVIRARSNKTDLANQQNFSAFLRANDNQRSTSRDDGSISQSKLSQHRRSKRSNNHEYSTTSKTRSIGSKKDSIAQQSVSSSGTGRSESLSHPVIETRLPVSSDKFDYAESREQPVATKAERENNLLHLLEKRANQENRRHRRLESENDSDTYETSTTSSGVSVGALSFPENTVMSRTTVSSAPSVSKTMQKLQNLSLDTFSHSSRGPISDGEESYSGSSNRISMPFSSSKRLSNNTTQTHFPGMTSGVRLGMIRVTEEMSEGREQHIMKRHNDAIRSE